MNSFLLVLVLSVAAIALAQDSYTTRFDNVNIDEIINNRRLLKGYTNCLLDKGPCSPDGAELKLRLPDGIKTNCEKCSEKQRDGAKKIFKHLINKEPEIWKELEAKFDPDHTYRDRYKDNAAKEGILLPN
uniref:CSP4 n=1 Tax=Holotrichia parallela TaxID=93412 RepID=A0A0G2YDA2_HOLPA|nr:CSP4 [Holotrichia parallela]